MSNEENTEERNTAIHEAAHFITSILGYKYEDIDEPRGEIPQAISIIRDAKSEGRMTDYGM